MFEFSPPLCKKKLTITINLIFLWDVHVQLNLSSYLRIHCTMFPLQKGGDTCCILQLRLLQHHPLHLRSGLNCISAITSAITYNSKSMQHKSREEYKMLGIPSAFPPHHSLGKDYKSWKSIERRLISRKSRMIKKI